MLPEDISRKKKVLSPSLYMLSFLKQKNKLLDL